MASSAEQLILRGISILIRSQFAPNNQEASAKHFMLLTNDLGPWFKDYAEEIAKPAIDLDFEITGAIKDAEGGSGVQQ